MSLKPYQIQTFSISDTCSGSTARPVPFPSDGYLVWAQWAMRATVTSFSAANFNYVWQLVRGSVSIGFAIGTTNQLVILTDIIQVQLGAATDPVYDFHARGFATDLWIPVTSRGGISVTGEASANTTGQVNLQVGFVNK